MEIYEFRAEVIMHLTHCIILFRISSSSSTLCSKLYALFQKLFCFLANFILFIWSYSIFSATITVTITVIQCN